MLGLKPRSTEEQPSWWHVLYASTLIVDEPTLVQSVLSAAFLSEVGVRRVNGWTEPLVVLLMENTVDAG